MNKQLRDKLLNTKHITVDLETLARKTTAPIIQIAAVEFDIETGEELDSFQRTISKKSLIRYNFQMGYDTVYWWMTETDEEAKKRVFTQKDAVDIRLALIDLKNWVDAKPNHVIWTHSSYDAPVLRNAAYQVGLNASPLNYRRVLDIRAIQYLTQECRPEDSSSRILHDAMDDCRYQAKWISNMTKQLINEK